MIGLVADIGGTNARFALVRGEAGSRPRLDDLMVLSCADHDSLGDAMRAYLHDVSPPQAPTRATVAVAGPASGDRIELTNRAWSFSCAETATIVGLERLDAINDYAAISLSLDSLGQKSLAPIGPLDAAMDFGTCRSLGVIGPGTGLGVGGLIRQGGLAAPLVSEGGHATFAPFDETEAEIARLLIRRLGRVSNERLLSGPGLRNLYEAIAEIRGVTAKELTPAQISELALDGSDTTCRESLHRFCAILGGVAGDLALTLWADAVFIAGGIAPFILDFLKTSRFRARFEDKGRFAKHLAAVPTLVITEPHPGLIGAAVHLIGNHAGAET